MNFQVRPARKDDLVEVPRLVNSAYRGESSKAGWTTEADLLGGQRTDPETLGRQMDEPGRQFLCVEERGSPRMLAVVSLERRSAATYYLGMLTVEPTRQADGIGRFLLNACEDFARAQGAKRMTMSVIQLRPELVAWYERRGYRQTGETAAFPYGDPLFGDPKRQDLHFLILEKSLEN